MIKIVADTTSGLPFELARQHEIAMIPQIVIFGEDSYRDDSEIDTETFLQKLKASPTLPKTAAPPPALYYPIFQAAQDKGEVVLVIAPSSNVSGTVRSAQSAAADFPDLPVHIVDTRTITGNAATLALLAAQWAAEGLDVDSVMKRLAALIDSQRTYFLVDTSSISKKADASAARRRCLVNCYRSSPFCKSRMARFSPVNRSAPKNAPWPG